MLVYTHPDPAKANGKRPFPYLPKSSGAIMRKEQKLCPANQISFGNRSNIYTAIIGSVTIITHKEIMTCWHYLFRHIIGGAIGGVQTAFQLNIFHPVWHHFLKRHHPWVLPCRVF